METTERASSNVQEAQALIIKLGVGSKQPMFSPEVWAAHLGSAPLAVAFSDQLKREWLPINYPSPDKAAQLAAFWSTMAEQVRAHLANDGESWVHLWAHILRVTGYALACGKEVGSIDPTHAFLLGILHDIGKLEEYRTGVAHEMIGALMTRKLLHDQTEFCPPEVAERIALSIAKRNRTDDFLTLVLYDADKLDKIGATGIARRLSTDFAIQNPKIALNTVDNDAIDFPEMHFPVSQQLAAAKIDFSTTFIKLVRSATIER